MRSRDTGSMVNEAAASPSQGVWRKPAAVVSTPVTGPVSGGPPKTSERRCYSEPMGREHLSPSYSSGNDFSVDVQGVRFGFSAADFASRVGAAAAQLRLLPRAQIGEREIADLVAVAVHGAILEPASALADFIETHREVLLCGEADLVHWLRRLVFRGAWIDQQVADGTLLPEFDEDSGFRYRSAATGQLALEEPAVPDWSGLARDWPTS